jgi:hypothetical protein
VLAPTRQSADWLAKITFKGDRAVLIDVGGVQDVFHQIFRIIERCEPFSGDLARRDQQTHDGSS